MAAATETTSSSHEEDTQSQPDSSPLSPAPASPSPSTPETKEKTLSISDLQGPGISPTLWYRILVFVFDLRHFRHRVDSEARLGHTVDPSYIGLPYFSRDEAEALRNTAVIEQQPHQHQHHQDEEEKDEDQEKEEQQQQQEQQPQQPKTLSQFIEEKLVPHEQRTSKPPSEQQNPSRGRRGDFRICRARELAPILERALGIDPNRLGRDRAFLRRLDMFGLGAGRHRRCHALSRHRRLYDPRYGRREEERRNKKPPVQRFGLMTSP